MIDNIDLNLAIEFTACFCLPVEPGEHHFEAR